MIFKNKKNKRSIEYANKIIDNKLIVHPLWEYVDIKNGIDWKQDPFNNGTWCYYLHSLGSINYLMNAYEDEKKNIYIEKAKEIITSWEKANNSHSKPVSRYAWKDHSTANRVVAIIYFWSIYINSELYEAKFEKELVLLLEKHGEFLYDDKNYNFRNNHGVFQDKALIELSIIFPQILNSNLWYEKAADRLLRYVNKFVSENGVHKENSSAYHILMLRLLREIDEFLSYHEKSIPELRRTIFKMEEHLAYIVKPNGIVPMTGDSGPDSIRFIHMNEIKNPKMRYVRSKGKKGKKPENEVVYKDEGIAIFKDNLKAKKELYIYFTAAFHSLAHKHADDLSFLLTIGNTDFFVDSGKYNYQEKDEYRKYFRSTFAHNSVTVDRETYELSSNQLGKSKVIKYGIKDDYSFVVGVHELYPGVKIERTLIYLKKLSSVLIHDNLQSSKIHTYSQIFNVGRDVVVEPLTKKKVLLRSTIDEKEVELIQVNHVTEFKNYVGEKKPIAGWQSSKFNEKYPITQLRFSNKSDNLEYKSIINLEPNSDNGIKNYVLKKSNKNKYTVICKNGDNFTFSI
ncbi:heparinase II/III domain-containing protein [Oceanobacillus sojae]|uniref:heparinase II/III domain-containing protein n=1 Tax=Oceanobacillus sojae TaxID=582851 RepID=UPI0036390098